MMKRCKFAPSSLIISGPILLCLTNLLVAQEDPALRPAANPNGDLTEQGTSAQTDSSARAAAHPGDGYSPAPAWPGPIDVPPIVRPHLLPMRMYHEPELPAPEVRMVLPDRMVELLLHALTNGEDLEVREVAGLHLARIARERYADISSTVPELRKLLTTSEHLRIRRVCALALAEADAREAAAELVMVAAESGIEDRQVIEGALIRWKAAEAAELWRNRLEHDLESSTSIRMACEGLAALEDRTLVPLMAAAQGQSNLEYSRRVAMARALSQLDGDVALAEADRLRTGSLTDRLLAVELCRQNRETAHEWTALLCEDPEDAVASAAWLQLLQVHPDSLLTHLPSGRQHRDAVVRETAARVMRLFPDAERLVWLQALMNDRHLTVRNVARQMLELVARERPELRDTIVQHAADILQPDTPDWQGLEQSLVLLGQLRADTFSPQSAALLDHPRPEVRAAAAWLIHLFPDERIRESVLDHVAVLEQRLADVNYEPKDPPEKLTLLFQYCGLLRIPDLLPLYVRQFSKGALGGADKRAAAMWAIGLLHERNPVPELVQQLEGRVNDRYGMSLEVAPVRRFAGLALGLMRAKAAIPTMERAYREESIPMLLAANAQWVLPLLGVPMPPDRNRDPVLYGDWRLQPTGVRQESAANTP